MVNSFKWVMSVCVFLGVLAAIAAGLYGLVYVGSMIPVKYYALTPFLPFFLLFAGLTITHIKGKYFP